MKVSIILPTYMERENITLLISEILKIFQRLKDFSCELIVVDDNSPDKTAEVCRRKFKKQKNVSVYVRNKNPGLAASIAYGISKSKCDYILVMDTDFNHDPKTIPLMLKNIKRYDLVTGSRFIKDGGMQNTRRYHLSRLYNQLLTLLLGKQCTDYLSGYFCIRKTHLKNMESSYIFQGYGEYFMRLLVYAINNNLKIIEVPVYYQDRKYGSSKSKFFKMFSVYSITAIDQWYKHLWN